MQQNCTEISLILPLLFTQQWLNQKTTLNNHKMTASSCEFQNYLGAVTLSSSLTQDSRSRGSVTVWAIVTPTCNIVRQQHLFSSCYNYNGYLQQNPSFSDPLELFNQNYKRSSCEPSPLGCRKDVPSWSLPLARE